MRWFTKLCVVLLMLTLSTTGSDAQVRPDSARTDSTRRPGTPVLDSAAQARARALAQRHTDSIAAFRRADTLKAPFVQFEAPPSFEIDEKLRFNREQILSSEATNLADLLDRVPGVTTYRTGWLASAHVASYLGDFARLRVFMDGLEMDSNDPRSNGILDLVDVHLWALDEIVMERAAGEIRVWCRTSTVTRTTPYTRTDVFTGDLNTNGFRGIFGRRFQNGFALQVAGQQYATQQGRSSPFAPTRPTAGRGDGGNQTLNARVGWARRRLSVDVFGYVTTRDRDSQAGIDSTPDIAAWRGARREGYVRFGYNDTASGFWSQLVLSSLRSRLEGLRPDSLTDTTIRSDTTRSREQKMLAVGYRTKSFQFSLTDRLRTFDGRAWHAPAARASYSSQLLSAGVFLEDSPVDSLQHVDGSLRFAPFQWGVVTASYSARKFHDETKRDHETVARVEGGLNWKRWWITGGVIRQSAFQQTVPTLIVGDIGRLKPPDEDGKPVSSNGILFGLRGPLYKSLRLDFQGVGWDQGKVFRPNIQVRTDLSLVTNWLSRFPKGQFGFNTHIIHELRDPIQFPYPGESPLEPTYIRSQTTRVITALVEIRIQRAVIFYHFHNMTGQPYEMVPGIVMPRQVQMYGVRWEFWN